MKRLSEKMLALIMLAVLGLGFYACSSSDDDSGDGTGVVGIWDGTSGSDKVVATFKSNGTGTLDWVIIDGDDTFYETESFSYVKDSDTSGTMTVKRADDDSSSRGSSGSSTYSLNYSITGDMMILTRPSTGRTLATLSRRK